MHRCNAIETTLNTLTLPAQVSPAADMGSQAIMQCNTSGVLLNRCCAQKIRWKLLHHSHMKRFISTISTCHRSLYSARTLCCMRSPASSRPGQQRFTLRCMVSSLRACSYVRVPMHRCMYMQHLESPIHRQLGGPMRSIPASWALRAQPRNCFIITGPWQSIIIDTCNCFIIT